MAIYKKTIPLLLTFALIMTPAAYDGKYEITVIDNTSPENAENSNIENSNQYDGN